MGWRFFPPGPYSQKNQKFFPESKTPLGGHANSPPLHTIQSYYQREVFL
nr:MAG TPA: hypothetical protein [Inoviridae sp.]